MNLDKFTKQELLEIDDNFNSWKWDDRIEGKPENFDDMPDFLISNHSSIQTKHDVIRPIIDELKTKLTEKEILYYHNVVKEINPFRMTEKEFKKWWFNHKIQKIFHIGFYSNKSKNMFKDILGSIAQGQQDKWINDTYGKN